MLRPVTRREFAVGLTAATCAIAQAPKPQVAITIDDFQWKQIPGGGAAQANHRLLEALARHSNLQAALFVCGRNVDNETGHQFVHNWSDAGHWIGNHSYSHLSYNSPNVTFDAFSADLLRGERLLSEFPGFQKIFRFPYLHEGNTAAKRDQMRDFLVKHGYRNGHVTIDTSDWYYDKRLRTRIEKNPAIDTQPYQKAYLAHILDRAAYYDKLARAVSGRAIPHTILLHYTLLNSLFLNDLLNMFENQGWQLISAETAYRDPVFLSAPDIVPAGESLVWSLAKASGNYTGKLRFPGESDEYEKDKLDRLELR